MRRCLEASIRIGLFGAIVLTATSAWGQENPSDRLEAALLDGDVSALTEFVAATHEENELLIDQSPLLHRAVANGDDFMIAALLDAGLPVNERGPSGDTALTLAVSLGHRSIADLLLERGASRSLRNASGLAAWQIAAQGDDHAFTARLLPNSDRKVAANDWLLGAARQGDKDAMRAALFAGADLDARTETGETILQITLAEQSWPVRAFLIGLPEWSFSGALADDDLKNLFTFAFSHPARSSERRFAAETLEALIRADIVKAPAVQSALSVDDSSPSPETERALLEAMSVDSETINNLFPEPYSGLPPLEFALRMDAPTGGVKPLHWKRIQFVLQEEGLYSGPIDGIAGQQTYDAIYAYVMGVVPVVVERAIYAHERADLDNRRFGVSETLSLTNNKTYYMSGERILGGAGSEAIGYTVLSEDRNFASADRFYYDATPVPTRLPRGWRGRSVSVSCEDGIAYWVSAAILGAHFTILLKEEPYYVHSLSGDGRFRAELPGGLPVVECR